MSDKKKTEMKAMDEQMLDQVNGGVSTDTISLENIASNVVNNITNKAASMVRDVDPGKVMKEIRQNFSRDTRVASEEIEIRGDHRNA